MMSNSSANPPPIIVLDIEEYRKPIVAEIKQRNPNITIHELDFENLDVSNEVAECSILLARPTKIAEIVQKLPKLKWVQSAWVGVEGVDEMKSIYENNPPFVYTRSEVGQGQLMAEYVLGHIIGWERRFVHFDSLQRQKDWLRDTKYRSLDRLTIGLLGVGEIGKKVAEVAKAFGMRVYGLTRSERSSGKCPHVDVFCKPSELGILLENSDFICNSLPQTNETKDLLNSAKLKHCKKRGSVFINVGRGDVISDEELISALRECSIAGAILDVFNEEPLPASSPLWSMQNVIVTPHTSAETFPHKVAESFLRNYQRFRKGRELECVVDWNAGY